MNQDREYRGRRSEESPIEHNRSKRVGFGILLLLAGTLFILSNLNMLPKQVEDILISWQMLVFGIGAVKFLFEDNKAFGGVMMIVGAFFLVPEVFDVSVDFVDVFWPLLLIGAGLMVIIGPGKNLFKKRNPIYSSDERYIEEMNIFGGNEKVMEMPNFKGGSIHNVFGGTELDLRDSEMEGDKAEIDLVCIFGGMELRVPDHWDVVIKVTPIFGGFSNKRVVRRTEGQSRKTLIITGTVIFGGGEIK
jgi:predicted membrane protein